MIPLINLLMLLKSVFMMSLSELKDKNMNCLILLVYSTENYKCPNCEVLEKSFIRKELEFKKLNFNENLRLSARFHEIKFPAVFYKKGTNFFKIPIEALHDLTKENMQNILENEDYKITRLASPLSFVSAFTAELFARGFPLFLWTNDKLYQFNLYIFLIPLFFLVVYIVHKLNLSEEEEEIEKGRESQKKVEEEEIKEKEKVD